MPPVRKKPPGLVHRLMKPELVPLLNCPARDCGAPDLELNDPVLEMINYRGGEVEEVREGAVRCPTCGRSYPVEDYVLSFEQLFPADLLEEARYWSDWYGFFWDRGYTGFFDLRSPLAPFISRGIEVQDPVSLSGADLPGTHVGLASDPRISSAHRIMDVGCGGGWSSLFLARRGHEVIAFDPSAANVRRAKQYAIAQGEFVEYLATGLGFLNFKPEVFDAVFALHSIHHVPDLANELAILRGWMREGAAIALDEHVRSDHTLQVLWTAMNRWLDEELVPRYATLDLEALRALPEAGSSALEDAGSDELVRALRENFLIDTVSTRYVGLDQFSFLYYLWRDRDLSSYDQASRVVDAIYHLMRRAHPGGAEYVTMVGVKTSSAGPVNEGVARMLEDIEKREGASPGSQSAQEIEKSISDLNRTIHNKNDHIAELKSMIAQQEAALAAKNAEIARQAQLIRRIESGRIIRLLNRITQRK